METDKNRERVLLYLYNELDAETTAGFEADLKTHPELRQLLEEESRFHNLYPTQSRAQISRESLEQNRLILHTALHRESRQKLRRDSIFTPWLPRIATLAAMLLLGFLLGQMPLFEKPGEPISPISEATQPFNLEDPRLLDMRLIDFDPSTGSIRLALKTVSHTVLEDNISNEAVQALFASTLQNDQNPANRLEAVELLQQYASNTRTKEALIHALLNDTNPGVRLKAIEALKSLSDDTQIRRALLMALEQDGNTGIRVEAIEAIKTYRDGETIEVLETTMKKDSNKYIRAEAFDAVQDWQYMLGE